MIRRRILIIINYSHQHPVFQSLPRDVDIFAATAMGRALGAALGARRLSLLEEHSLKTSKPTRLTGDDADGDYDEDGDSDDADGCGDDDDLILMMLHHIQVRWRSSFKT